MPDTGLTLDTKLSGLRIVTILTIDIASLKKYGSPVPRTIDAAERDDPIDDRFHLAYLSFQNMTVSGSTQPQCSGILQHGFSAGQLFKF